MNFIKSVEAFNLAVEEGSFTNVAEILDITPSMLSRRIRELEQYLGCKLLNRTTRKQGLTTAGECFLKYSSQMLSMKKEAQDAIQQLNEHIAGNIRISAPIAFGNRVLTPLVAKFLIKYPEVNIEMDLGDHKVDLIDDNFQLAFRIGDVIDEGVVAIRLPPYSMALVASPEYLNNNPIPQHPNDLLLHDCICFSQWHSNKTWKLEKDNQVHNININARLLCNTGESIRQAALNGLGIALNSTIIFNDDINTGQLIRILPDYSIKSHDMNIIRLPLNPVPPVIKAFTQFIKDNIDSKYPDNFGL